MDSGRAGGHQKSRRRDRGKERQKRRSKGFLPEHLRDQEVPDERELEEPEAEEPDIEQEREEEDAEESAPFLLPEGSVTSARDLWLWTGESLVWARRERSRLGELERLRAALEDLVNRLRKQGLLEGGQSPWSPLSGALAQKWIRPWFPKRPQKEKNSAGEPQDQDAEPSPEPGTSSVSLVEILEPWSLRDLTRGTSFPLGRLIQGRGEGRGGTKGGGSDLPRSAQRAWLRREARDRSLVPPLETSTMKALRGSYEETLSRWNEAVQGVFGLSSPPFGLPQEKTWCYQRRKDYEALLGELLREGEENRGPEPDAEA